MWGIFGKFNEFTVERRVPMLKIESLKDSIVGDFDSFEKPYEPEKTQAEKDAENKELMAKALDDITTTIEETGVVLYDAKLSPQQLVFTEQYVKTKDLNKSLAIAKVSRSAFKKWLKSDTKFAEVFNHAVDSIADALEGVAINMALAGNEKMLIKLLEAYRPQKFSPKRDISVKQDVNVHVESWQELARKAMDAEREKVRLENKPVYIEIEPEGDRKARERNA